MKIRTKLVTTFAVLAAMVALVAAVSGPHETQMTWGDTSQASCLSKASA